MDMSQPDDDGVYRNGATKRKARTELAMQCLTELWNAACKDVSFPVPDSGIGFAAVGSLARGQLGPSSDLDLVIIYEPRTLNDQQLNELANKLWYPLWDSGLDLDHSIRTRAQCEEVTDHDLPAAMGWLDVKPIAGDTALITTTATSILERWRKAARKRLPELLDSAKARLDEFGRLQYVNQPDIKEARGGLRDSVLVSALAASWLADRPHGIYDEAVERLLDVRDCIHLVAGKDTNLMLTPYQAKVAAMLGLADPTWPENERAAYSIDDLQTLIAVGMVTMGIFFPLQGWMMAIDGILIGARDYRYLAVTCTLTAVVYVTLILILANMVTPALTSDLMRTAVLWAAFNVVLMGGRGLSNGLRVRSDAWMR